MSFTDRVQAGARLADKLASHRGAPDTVVLGLPRGGVVVAAEVARRLELPLDAWLARKVGAPQQPEFGVGAVSHHGVVVMDDRIVKMLGIETRELEGMVEAERAELQRRLARFRRSGQPANAQGKLAILVDDGLATGSTAKAAIEALRRAGPRKVILALPVAPADALHLLRALADQVIVPETPLDFEAVGKWYQEFKQTSEEEVIHLLDRMRANSASPA